MRVDATNRVIEIGNILYTPAMQRTIGATEAQYLFAAYVFDDLGYRRYEWKCNDLNAPSKRAALRLGFVFEGRVPSAHDRQGAQSRHRVVLDARFGMAVAARGVRTLARAGEFRRGGTPEDRLGEPQWGSGSVINDFKSVETLDWPSAGARELRRSPTAS